MFEFLYYKKRWEIELFFKWIKQNLKIKRFIGHSFNAVMIQVITAIITFIMLKLVKEKANTAYGLLDIRRFLKYRITSLINKEIFTWELLLVPYKSKIILLRGLKVNGNY